MENKLKIAIIKGDLLLEFDWLVSRFIENLPLDVPGDYEVEVKIIDPGFLGDTQISPEGVTYGIGSISDDSGILIAESDFERKQELVRLLRDKGFTDKDFMSYIDPTAIVANEELLGIGTVIYPGVILYPCVKVGDFAYIKAGKIIKSQTYVGDYQTYNF